MQESCVPESSGRHLVQIRGLSTEQEHSFHRNKTIENAEKGTERYIENHTSIGTQFDCFNITRRHLRL